MSTEQPEALRLADTLDLLAMDMKTPRMAATELRRQHAEIETLRAGYRATQAAPIDVGVQRDAERYRYLRNDVLVAGEINETLYVHVDHPDRWALVGTELDEAIDAARGLQERKP